jgi:general secretion pathway protein I
LNQRGFSLLEVLVAFTILALSLGVLMQIFSGSLRNADLTGDQAQATALAQTILAATGVEAPLAEGDNSGIHADKFRWSVHIAPFVEPPRPEDSAVAIRTLNALELWEVSVQVTWGSGTALSDRAVSLTTLRVQRPPRPT